MKSFRRFSIRNKAGLFTALAALFVLAAVLSISFGAVWISPINVIKILSGAQSGTGQANIILLARLPRTCGCVLAGAALAVSGAVIQSVLSNPLAAPNVIGVNSGAGLAIALFCAVFPTKLSLMPLVAFAGALFAVLLVLFIAEKTGASKMTLVLAGVAVSGIFSAVIDAVVTFVPEALNGYTDFKIGGLAGATMAKIVPAFWVIILALAAILLLSNELDVLALGAGTAQSLGLNVRRVRIAALVLSAALCGAAVSFAGLIGFVGLIVPHIMRTAFDGSSRDMVISCALGGSILVTLCDVLSRVLFAPFELPVGIMLSCLGGPFFIWLLIVRKRGVSHG